MRDAAQVVRTLRTIHCLLQRLSPRMLRPDEREDCEQPDEQVHEQTEPASEGAGCSMGVQTEDDAGKAYGKGFAVDVEKSSQTEHQPQAYSKGSHVDVVRSSQQEHQPQAYSKGSHVDVVRSSQQEHHPQADSKEFPVEAVRSSKKEHQSQPHCKGSCDETTDTGGRTREDLRSMESTQGRLSEDGSCLVPPSSAPSAAEEGSREVCNCCDSTCGEVWRCSRCQVTTYCSQQCQRWDWEEHKTACNRIKKHRASPSGPKGVRYIPDELYDEALGLVLRTAAWLSKYAARMMERDLENRVATMCIGTVSIAVREWFEKPDRGRNPSPMRGVGMEYERAVLKDDFWRLVENLERWQRGSSRKKRTSCEDARQQLDDIGAKCIGEAVVRWVEIK